MGAGGVLVVFVCMYVCMDVPIKVYVHLRSTDVLQCDRSSKNGIKFLLWKRSMHRLYGFWMVEVHVLER